MSNISITNGGSGGGGQVDAIEFIQGNDGLNVPPNPTTKIILVVGDNTQGIDTSGNIPGYTETITAFDATTAQKGVTLLADNAETIAGTVTTKATTPDDIKAKLGVQTLHGIPYGNATTGAIQWLAEATDGQIPIGDTGGVPILGNITSLDGTVSVTNGPGTIDLSTAVSSSDIATLTGNDSVVVGPEPITFNVNIIGDTVQGVHVNGNAGTWTETITIDDATTAQKGVILLADNAETIAGTDTTKAVTPDDLKAKLGSQTLHGIPYGNATTGAIQWLAEATDGQIPIGDTGGVPILGNITSLDGTVVVTNGAGTIDLSVANQFSDTAQTIGAVTADLLTIPLGVVAGTFQFEARVKAFESTTPAGAGYNIYATFTTDGIAATLVGDQPIFNEDAALSTADAYFVASGNNAVLQVLGVALLTIDWAGETEVT
jgi:hypothetical protein